MNIDSTPVSLATLFQIGDTKKYIVPVYQRNYSWKEEQIEALFNDIYNEDSGYYVGNLLINNAGGNESIIDGQQRLTTLSLLMLALYAKMADKAKDQETSERMKETLWQDKGDIRRQLLVDVEKLEPRLQLLKKDQEIWSKLVKILGDDANLPTGYGQFAFFKRYLYIQNNLLDDLSAEEMHNLYENKLNRIVLLKISVPDLNDAYQVFASLNSKGLPLTPLDLLKNMYLSKHGTGEKWTKLTEVFSDGDNADKAKMTRFVLNNYDAFEQVGSSSLTKGSIVKSYQKLFDKYGADYIDKLISRAEVYKTIDTDEQEYDYNLSGLAKLNATTSYPLLLNLLVKQEQYQLSDEQINQIVKMIINLFIRRNFVLTPKSSNLRSAFNSLRRDIEKEGLVGDQLMERFARRITELAPDDEMFKRALKNGIYDVNTQTTRFILIMLERLFDDSYFHKGNPKSSLDEYSGSKPRWTIEHIVPQGNLPKYWVDVIGGGDAEKAKELQDKNVHRLGNLTLTPYNSGLGQRTFEEKINYKDDQAEVGFKLPIFLNDSIDKDAEEFNIDSINKREEVLEDKLMEMVAF